MHNACGMSWVGLIAAAFLAGGIPFAFLAAKLLRGEDVRQFGSGNPGATNASRMWPKRWQLPVFLALFLLDAGKGLFAAWCLPHLFGLGGVAPAAAAAAAVAGHTWTPFLRFRGGKGVATTLGALLALDPVSTLIAVGVFFAIFLRTRIVALGSLGVAVTLPIAVVIRGQRPSIVAIAVALGILIIVRHRSNIRRLRKGIET